MVLLLNGYTFELLSFRLSLFGMGLIENWKKTKKNKINLQRKCKIFSLLRSQTNKRTMDVDTRFGIGAEVVIMIGCPCWPANDELLIPATDWSIGVDDAAFDSIDIDAGERIGVFGVNSSCFISCLISCLIGVFWFAAKIAGLDGCCFLTTATGALTGIGCGGGIDSIFCTSKIYAWAVGVPVQHTSSVVVDARTRDTRDATGGTSTSKYHKSLQQTCYLQFNRVGKSRTNDRKQRRQQHWNS